MSRYHTDKAGALLDDFATTVSDFDPNTAGKAQTEMIRVELNKLADRLHQSEMDVRREAGETEELRQTYGRYLDAARVLQLELDQIHDGGRRQVLEISLAKLIDELERLKPELEWKLQDDQQAEIWTGRLRTSFEMLTGKLEQIATDPSHMKRMTDPATCSGMSSEGSRLTAALAAISVALEAINRDVASARAETEALERKFRQADGDRLDDDPHIAAALGQKSLTTVVDSVALRDRLARLEDHEVLPAASAA